MVEDFSRRNNIAAVWGRVFFLYGPHEKPGRLVSSVIRSLLHEKEANCSHGRQIRDFLHVADVASAFTAILDSDVTGPVNIASGQPVRIGEIVAEIARQIGRKDLVRLGAIEASPAEPAVFVADVQRLFSEVGWKPKHDLSSGIADSIQWWKRHPELLAVKEDE